MSLAIRSKVASLEVRTQKKKKTIPRFTWKLKRSTSHTEATLKNKNKKKKHIKITV
jgi:hypothetical protein